MMLSGVNSVRRTMDPSSGFVNRRPWDFDAKDYVDDVGIGLRLDLPIGPLRIDYGIPLEKGPYKDAGSGKFNFNVGYQF